LSPCEKACFGCLSCEKAPPLRLAAANGLNCCVGHLNSQRSGRTMCIEAYSMGIPISYWTTKEPPTASMSRIWGMQGLPSSGQIGQTCREDWSVREIINHSCPHVRIAARLPPLIFRPAKETQTRINAHQKEKSQEQEEWRKPHDRQHVRYVSPSPPQGIGRR